MPATGQIEATGSIQIVEGDTYKLALSLNEVMPWVYGPFDGYVAGTFHYFTESTAPSQSDIWGAQEAMRPGVEYTPIIETSVSFDSRLPPPQFVVPISIVDTPLN